MTEHREVIVVGAGPAGATTAALLARRGLDVLVLEKQEFPRFRIGESLLPAAMPVLERLGIAPAEDTHVYKRGAEFVCEATERSQCFFFDESMPGCASHAWHVDRSRFDMRMRDLAVADGAEVRHGEAVTDCGADVEAAWVTTRTGTMRCRYLVDASGQSRLLARRANAVKAYREFGMSSVFTHFEGCEEAMARVFAPHNDIRIMLRSDGWGWIIPLPLGRLSIGMVSKGKFTPEELDAGLLKGPLAQGLTRGARRLETRVVGNFSYRNAAPVGPRYATVGDASCFLDPVFSSGVTLALRGADSLVDVVGPALDEQRENDPQLLADHCESMDRAYRTFAALIARFYNTRFAESMFLGKAAGYDMRRGVMSVLAGDVWRFDNPFQNLLLKARRPERQIGS